jgi:hypothetical protein
MCGCQEEVHVLIQRLHKAESDASESRGSVKVLEATVLAEREKVAQVDFSPWNAKQ